MLKEVKNLKLLSLSIISSLLVLTTSCVSNNLEQNNNLLVSTQNLAQPNLGQEKKVDNPQVLNAVFEGIVVELLPDDNDGSKHQHFMMKMTTKEFKDQLVYIAHNIDIAPYVPVKVGSKVEIKGDLITNESPMVLHWTHRTLGDSTHPEGYIKLDGKIYK